MKLIPSGQALEFLGQAAPRPWLKRMLLWMMLDEKLSAYFTHGVIQPHTTVSTFLYGLENYDPKRPAEEQLKQGYDADFAAKLIGKNTYDRVDDEPTTWTETDEPHAVSVGFFMFAELRDWEAGSFSGTLFVESGTMKDVIFWDEEEHLLTNFERADFDFELSGLCFDAATIEMLLPSHVLEHQPSLLSRAFTRPVGRPPKWNWEGALEHLVAQAQKPDGLPSGPGAQAAIERMLSDWFVENENGAPAESQIRTHVQRVMRRIEMAKVGL